ncbi:MAG: rhodanese-like domain-containing protein [Bacteroidetes bacterium]|jgi:rhodanese-related sulfurtransferase|nr:rhodanese-like domain-containing protein [Bacteroidota bacterium]
MKAFNFFAVLFLLITIASCKDNSDAQLSKVITVEEAHQLLNSDEGIQLIDVRTPEEYEEKHIPYSQNICVTDKNFKERASKLDKNRPIYVYCRSGKRSADAAQRLRQMGFKEVYDMEGGIIRWEEYGYELNNQEN